MGRLSRPLNSDAVKAADDEFYAKHPELVKEGKRIPLSATDPSQAGLRQEWVELYKKHGGKEEDDTNKPPAKKPADPVQPCPLQKSISGQFKETEVKCGDPGHVEADGVQISEGANTTFSIYRVRDNKALKSVSAPMNGQKVRDLAWQPKRPNDHQKNDKYLFDVSADGQKAKSSNQFGFFEYPDYGPETKTIACSSGRFGWTGKFDIQYSNDEVVVTVKIKLINRQGQKPASATDPMPDAGDPVSDEDKASMKADVEGKLSKKMKLYRETCAFAAACICLKPIKIVVDFVESGQHHDVNLFQGAGRANASNWTRVKTRDNSWAHETGHLLAWYDEYTGGATGTTPRWQDPAPSHVMSSGLTVPPEYGWDFRDWFAGKTGEQWKIK